MSDQTPERKPRPCGCPGCEGQQGHAGFHQFTMGPLPAGGIAPWEEKTQAIIANLAADLSEARRERDAARESEAAMKQHVKAYAKTAERAEAWAAKLTYVEEEVQPIIANLRADLAEAKAHPCRDCCCARSWQALGVAEHTGLSIPEHIEGLKVRVEQAEAALAEAQERIKTLVIYGDSASELLGREAGKVVTLRAELADAQRERYVMGKARDDEAAEVVAMTEQRDLLRDIVVRLREELRALKKVIADCREASSSPEGK